MVNCVRALLAAFVLATPGNAGDEDRPAFRVDVPAPTRDKPQSKLWFAHGAWWAWLPVKNGSSVWKRTEAGWGREVHLDHALRGLPGQADVWADADNATAVLVAADSLAVFALRWVADQQRYEPAAQVVLPSPPPNGAESDIETATIARDGRGRWWIAYNWQREMHVRSAPAAGGPWSEPIAVNAGKASGDDLCAIAALPAGVGVVWSDQEHDAIYFRFHRDADPPNVWRTAETVQQGGKTADDHIHTAVGRDGTLYVATKNSLDEVGRPQQVLRVRNRRGRWTNHPYATRTASWQPSRPIVLLGGDLPPRLILIHTLYGMERAKPRTDVIGWQTSALAPLDLSPDAQVLLDSGFRLNDATSCKAPLPAGRPWIALASDQEGRVFEARLDRR